MTNKEPKDVVVTLVVGDCLFNKIEKGIRCVYDVEVRSTATMTYISFYRSLRTEHVTTWAIPTAHIVNIEIS